MAVCLAFFFLTPFRGVESFFGLMRLRWPELYFSKPPGGGSPLQAGKKGRLDPSEVGQKILANNPAGYGHFRHFVLGPAGSRCQPVTPPWTPHPVGASWHLFPWPSGLKINPSSPPTRSMMCQFECPMELVSEEWPDPNAVIKIADKLKQSPTLPSVEVCYRCCVRPQVTL